MYTFLEKSILAAYFAASQSCYWLRKEQQPVSHRATSHSRALSKISSSFGYDPVSSRMYFWRFFTPLSGKNSNLNTNTTTTYPRMVWYFAVFNSSDVCFSYKNNLNNAQYKTKKRGYDKLKVLLCVRPTCVKYYTTNTAVIKTACIGGNC